MSAGLVDVAKLAKEFSILRRTASDSVVWSRRSNWILKWSSSSTSIAVAPT